MRRMWRRECGASCGAVFARELKVWNSFFSLFPPDRGSGRAFPLTLHARGGGLCMARLGVEGLFVGLHTEVEEEDVGGWKE
jgi:hypothetical protein